MRISCPLILFTFGSLSGEQIFALGSSCTGSSCTCLTFLSLAGIPPLIPIIGLSFKDLSQLWTHQLCRFPMFLSHRILKNEDRLFKLRQHNCREKVIFRQVLYGNRSNWLIIRKNSKTMVERGVYSYWMLIINNNILQFTISHTDSSHTGQLENREQINRTDDLFIVFLKLLLGR